MKKKVRVLSKSPKIVLPDSGAELPSRVRSQAAAFRAHQIYMANIDMSLDYIIENYRFDPDDDNSPMLKEIVSITTLRNIAAKMGWAERRKQLWERVEANVMDALESDLTRLRLQEINQLKDIYDHTLARIKGVEDPNDKTKMLIDPVKPRSLEGLINAFIRLDARMDEKRDRIQKDIVGSATRQPDEEYMGTVGAVPDLDDDIDDNDAAWMAHRLAMKRAGLLEVDDRDVEEADEWEE